MIRVSTTMLAGRLARLASLTATLIAVGYLANADRADAKNRCRKTSERSGAEFAAAGTFAAGERTYMFEDTSRSTPPNGSYSGAPSRRLATVVWYPAQGAGGKNARLDATGAPYPVVLYSHGFSAFNTSEQHLARHLASRGYVVAAPNFPLAFISAPGGPTVDDVASHPGDLSFLLDQLILESGKANGPLAGAVDPERVGASGLSLGGLTTLLATYHPNLREPRIRAALPMAAPACFFTKRFFRTARVPLLLMHGDSDLLVPYKENAKRVFKRARKPRQLVTLRNGSHTGFTAFATGFDQTQHFDLAIGCAVIDATLDVDPEQGLIPGLGGKQEGHSPFLSYLKVSSL